MKPIQKHHPLFAAIATGVLLYSCAKIKTPTPQKPITYTVSTLAGNITAGATDGAGIAASFKSPSTLAMGSDGELYVGDWGNNLVRKINLSTAAVTTFAGKTSAGLVNGSLASALFYGTANIVFDKSGDLFIADEENNVIREITAGGNVVTLAGSGVAGLHDGAAITAQFNHPEGMVVDASGNLYVADGNNNAIRKVVIATGVVTTYSGTGVAGFNNGNVATATYHSPYGLAMDARGNIYVADIVNNCIRKITVSTGTVSTFAGSGTQGLTNGPAATATFYFPGGVTFDSKGNLFVSELRNNTIRKVSTDGTVSTFAGTGAQGATDGPAASTMFYQPLGMTFDGNGNLYVTDEYNNEIRKISPQ